jgi:hypothetical protein
MLNLRKDGSASKEPLGLNQEFPPLFSFSSLFFEFFVMLVIVQTWAL